MLSNVVKVASTFSKILTTRLLHRLDRAEGCGRVKLCSLETGSASWDSQLSDPVSTEHSWDQAIMNRFFFAGWGGINKFKGLLRSLGLFLVGLGGGFHFAPGILQLVEPGHDAHLVCSDVHLRLLPLHEGRQTKLAQHVFSCKRINPNHARLENLGINL